jgi:hypothetical protein
MGNGASEAFLGTAYRGADEGDLDHIRGMVSAMDVPSPISDHGRQSLIGSDQSGRGTQKKPELLMPWGKQRARGDDDKPPRGFKAQNIYATRTTHRSRRGESSGAHTVFATPCNWMDARSRRSRQLPDDATAPAAHRSQAVRSFRPIHPDAQVRVRPHANRAASDARSIGRMGCASCRCREAPAVLSVRHARVPGHRAARD